MRFRFEPVTDNDKPMLRDWLSTPDAQTWWGDPDHEIKLIYDGEVTGESSGYIVHGEDGPFAYIQSWPSEKQPPEAIKDEPWVAEQPAGTLGVDITIGRPDLLGKGLGTEVMRQFCQKLFNEGAPRLIIDPDASNARAVRAYEKAGFSRFDQYTNADGSITLLMEMFPPEGHTTL
ncbi:MAG: GNAT family N-acetyltransferase [Rhizobiales bacterium]|nr:GNAT family N-acetyltransferase [Hyphomicrobiales bacterium]MBO6699492.1 GNAT family N-acetyltransferase [Hyphomicrobiales bacterium]MBO6737030.1 GNAT family N-acetyltransferase [Hyphomicrobiales bacterium]MBO6911896.1 GNAT family N-acetyltransferase [Hyphomicrobiales bacterium]MBO6954832.1 GNAT family N-acetyltransferase [Hyphomicrobiales bacterium]